jgi:hypothetical protein
MINYLYVKYNKTKEINIFKYEGGDMTTFFSIMREVFPNSHIYNGRKKTEDYKLYEDRIEVSHTEKTDEDDYNNEFFHENLAGIKHNRNLKFFYI